MFLSGNGPLVQILQEALARDKVRQERLRGRTVRKGAALSEVRAFIQNVHHFRDECLVDADKPPVEHVAIFDEAQRAWNLKQTVDFMKRKKGRADFNQSEPEFLISCLDRHEDWAVVICLVGGGQEINTGEAGISEWLTALDRSFPEWRIYVSDRLVDSEYGAGRIVEALRSREHVEFKSDLHLATSIRSFRSENVSKLVKELLDLELDAARETLRQVQSATRSRSPGTLTPRGDGSAARLGVRNGTASWCRRRLNALSRMRWTSRLPSIPCTGSSTARTMSARPTISRTSPRSSTSRDWRWTGPAWCGMRTSASRLKAGSIGPFAATGGSASTQHERQSYLKNAYRVLLTRARQGMVVVVPRGDDEDPTRDPAYYDRDVRLSQPLRDVVDLTAAESIRVNAVRPGPIFTRFHERRATTAGKEFEEFKAEFGRNTILKRPGTPREVAACILFLASDEVSYVTGTCLFVDGGQTAM